MQVAKAAAQTQAMARICNTVLALLLVAAAAATARATDVTFDFEADLDGWAALRRSWRWSDRDGLSSSLPADWRDGFAVLDQASSDELRSPQISMPEGGSVSMTFYLRSKHVGSNTLTVSYFVDDESFPLLDLGDYSLPNTTDWVTVSADIPPTPNPLSVEVFCFNGYDTVPGEDLLGCALDQIVVHINYEQTESPTDEPTTPGTEAPTEATTEPVTDRPTEPETDAPTQGPTEPETDAPTEGPTEPETDAPTEEPTEPETDAPTEPETDAPTEGPTEPETDAPTEGPTEPETDAPTEEPTEPETDAPTEGPTEPETDAPTEEPTEPETDAPTEEPTEPETDAPTEGPTEPETVAPTEGPTEPETDAPTEEPTEPETDAPTEGPTEPETDAPTEGPTEPETDAPTEPETDAPTEGPTEPETDAPTEPETDAPTEGPTEPETEAPTEEPTEPETEAPTEGPTEPETEAPTEPETEAPTEGPTEPETDAPTEEPTAQPSTTETPDGPLIYTFNTGAAGWTLSHLNGATWTRKEFNSNGRPVNDPPNGPWVLEIQPDEVLAGTVVAQSPLLEAVDTRMVVAVTFWMDGAEDFQAELKVRRKTDFSTFDVNPIMNLDPFGDQENHRWITYLATLDGLTPGQSFNVILEGSLGGHPNNSVAVDMVEIRGVREAALDHSSFFDFENGLQGWSSGNLEGGRWLLQTWSELDPSVGVPRPSDGENFLFVERFDIHSGVITVESPVLTLTPGAKHTLELKFWTRGSVVYPATLRIRKKTPDGRYDALPFLNLRNYGDTDNAHWISFSRQYLIPGDTGEVSYQLVIEADLGSDLDNLVALDDLKVTTEFASPAGRS